MQFFRYFQRITTSGNYVPEIDGLRFFAIFWVVLYHWFLFWQEKVPAGQYVSSFSDYPLWTFCSEHLYQSVNLFFVLSGFILGLPFLQAKKVDLRYYYLRRLTRLEPPYLLTVLALLGIHFLLIEKIPLETLYKSTLASLLYCHNFLFGREHLPLLNTAFWSLEVEIQFYLLAPFLAWIYRLKSFVQNLLFPFLIVLSSFLSWRFQAPFRSLYDYFPYFLMGMWLASLYQKQGKRTYTFAETSLTLCLGIAALFGLNTAMEFHPNCWEVMLLPWGLGLLLWVSLNDTFWCKWLSAKFLTLIGGMTYSIYLWHLIVISFFGNKWIVFSFTGNYFLDFYVHFLLISIPILSFSALYYLLIEKPCMNTKILAFLLK